MVSIGLVLVLSLVGGARADSEPSQVISVTGRGEVTVKPDLAEIRTGVVSRATTAEGALNTNSDALGRVIEGLAGRGIVAPDVQTQSFSVSPLYGSRKQNPAEAPPIVGFQVSNQVLVRLHDVSRAGAILDALVQLGANQVGSVSFRVSDPTEALDQARIAAVADARRKALLFADAAGVSLGRVVSIHEGGGVRPQTAARSLAFAEAVPIEPGEQAISASVSIEFLLGE